MISVSPCLRGDYVSRLEVAACLAILVGGVYGTSLGPALTVLADDFDVSLDTAGLLITVLFFGSILASGAMAVWLHRFDSGLLTGTGLLLVAFGTAGIALAPAWEAALASVALSGLGGGLMDAGSHTIVARVSPDVTRGINRLNVCFAVGAVAGPLWSGSVLAVDDGAREFVYLGIAVLAAGVSAFVLSTRSTTAIPHSDEAPTAHAITVGMDSLAWVMGALLFLYVGAEFGLGSWVASYADEEFEAGTFVGGLITAGYWGALMAGRMISGALFARGVPATTVLKGSIGLGLIASAGIALANDAFAIAVGAAFLTGLAFGPVWPSAMAIAAQGRSRTAPSALVTIGNSGGFVFPWLQGRLLVSSGATTGIALSAVLCAAMLAIAVRAPRRVR